MGNELAINDQIKGLVFQNKNQHAAMLPADQQSQVNGWLSSAFAALSKDKNLAQAALSAPETFVNALNDAAQHGLRPGTTEYYLTPRKNKGRMEILGIVGYQGHVEMMYRSGKVRSVVVEAVHENDVFEWVQGDMERPKFSPAGGSGKAWFAGKKERGELVGAFAYAIFNDGSVSQVVIADADRIAAAKEASAGSHSQFSPWNKHPKSMYMKTAARDLTKWVPTSAVDLRERAQATLGDAAVSANVNAAGQVLPRVEEPEAQDVYEAEFVEAIEADGEDSSAVSGELASDAQMKEIQRRTAKAGYEGKDQIEADLRIQVKDDSASLDSLTREQADIFLAWLPR